jgi:hypothetical protein
MEKLTLELPALYGDHHVTEVRRILLEMAGVEDVYASSSFHVVEVTYDPVKINPDAITAVLGEAGYLGELPVPSESGASAYLESDSQTYFRHSTVYENTRQSVSFAQNVTYAGRPLWPCPGMGPLKTSKPEEE